MQLEAAGCAEALYGWRRENHDEGVLDLAVVRIQPACDGARAVFRSLALLEGFQCGEDDARAGAVSEPADRKAGEGDGMFDIGVIQGNPAHFADHILCPVERGAVRQLGETDQILLVLHRHEAARNRVEEHVGRREQHEIQPHGDGLVPGDPPDTAAIGIRAPAENRIKATEQPAERKIDHPGQAILRCVMAFQQQSGEGR